MKIAFVLPNSVKSFGGAEKKIVETARLLVARGYDVELRALPRNRPGLAFNAAIPGDLNYIESWSHVINADVVYVAYILGISFIVKTKAPIIAGLHSPLLFRPKSLLKRAVKEPLLYGSLVYPLYALLAKNLAEFEIRRFKAVRALTRSCALRHKRVYIIPQWVNTEVFKPHDAKNEEFTVIFAGRHVKEKGWDTYLQAALHVKKLGYRDIRFRCAGRGVSWIEGLGFLDERDLAEHFSKAHITVHPSLADTFGNVIVESMACGTPVITTPIPAHKDIGGPQIFAQPDPEAVANKIIEVYELWRWDPKDYQNLSRDCMRSAQKYSVNRVFPQFIYMLRDLNE